MRSAAKPQVRYCASSAFVYTNAQNGLPALPPEVRFCSLGPYPKPREQPRAGAGCAFDSRTLVTSYTLGEKETVGHKGCKKVSSLAG